MNLDKLSQSATNLEEANLLIEELVSLVKAQQLEIESLKTDIEQLQSQQGRSSRNSSKAPSFDSPEQRKKRTCKPRSSRSKGAQLGHEKHERRMLSETEVNQIHRYTPDTLCICGGTVTVDHAPTYRHQVFDVPEVKYHATEHQIFSGCCDLCGKKKTAHWPDWIPSGQMDAGLISTIALLSGQFHLSLRQIQAFLKRAVAT